MFCPHLRGPRDVLDRSLQSALLIAINTTFRAEEPLLVKAAHSLENRANIPYFLQELGNFPSTMGYFNGRVWLILAVCS
jgi:hypothetical protein